MKKYSFVVFLVVGCLGQDLPTGGLPSTSAVTGNLPTGSTPNVPVGGAPNVPNVPVGGVPNVPVGTPNVPNVPVGGVPNVPVGTPNVPNVPVGGVPNVPNQNDNQGTGGTGGTPSPIGPPPNVNRPCRRYDIQCVRYFFKDHSHCKQPYGKVPEPLFRAISNQFYPAFNLTITNTNAYYTGFNTGRVEDLYVNRETDKVVLVIEFRGLKKSSKDVFFRYHRRAREPIITYGYSNVEFKSLLVTVTIPQVNDLRLDKADVFGYSNEIPILDIDPRLGESSDPVVAKSFAAFLADRQAATTEYLLTEGAYYAAVFIQNVICDFGLKLV